MKRFQKDEAMIRRFQKFRDEEAGAVTVDWVVLTAAIVSLAGLATYSLKNNSDSLANKTETYLGAIVPGE